MLIGTKRFIGTNLRNIVTSLGHLYRQPFATLYNTIILSFTTIIPILSLAFISSFENVQKKWSNDISFIIFLNDKYTEQQLNNINYELSKVKCIQKFELISKQDSLSNFAPEILDVLEKNPLPDIIKAKILLSEIEPEQLEKFANMPGVERITNNLQDLTSVKILVKLIRNTLYLISALLILTMHLIVFNIVSLLLEKKQKHITIKQLIGASYLFIQSEYIYFGLWYSFIAALLGMFVTKIIHWSIVHNFSNHINSELINIKFEFISSKQIVFCIFFYVLAGTLSAALSVHRQMFYVK